MKNFAYKMGYDAAMVVFANDYYHGKWFVTFRGRKRVCGNHTGAKAWADYLQRRFGSWSANGITTGKVV